MRDELLRTAASALRDTGVPARDGHETFGRVLRDVRRYQRRRRMASVTILPLALLVTTVGAWAATTGRLTALARWIGGAPSALPSGPLSPDAPRAPMAPQLAPQIVPVAPAEAPPPTEAPPPGMDPRPVRGASLSAPARRPLQTRTPAPAQAAVARPSEDELYRQAHEAHFVRGDYVAALALWDRYLAVSPIARFTVEARYNRAIALLRLGRRAEGAHALQPFANGDYGSYRAAEARALLQR